MLLFLKKNADEESEAQAVQAAGAQAELAEFIPYHSHFNAHTLLTKNGELMQIIKIASNNQGLNYESGDATDNTVRDTIRRAILECLGSDRFSFWVHTVRKRRDIESAGSYGNDFAAYAYEQWRQTHRWKYQYYNEIYVSILYEGQDGELADRSALKYVVAPKANRRWRNRYLDDAYDELDATVSAMLQKIRQHYNAYRLSLVERASPGSHRERAGGEGIFYSEPMEFLGTLINLRDETFPLPDCDLSQALPTAQMTFGFNALEARNDAGRRFGAMLALKQYREMPPEAVDRVLQAPVELIVSQSFNFIPHTEALKHYKAQKRLFDTSGDGYSIKASGLHEMLASHKKRPVDFGHHQTSIMVLVDEYRLLDEEVAKTQEAFAALGLITIREDIRLEDCFWSQLPGNFEFIRREDILNTVRCAGFSRLNRFPIGTQAGNHWGEAVALAPTTVGSPYFFNFHQGDNGHAVLFDFNSFNDHMGHVLTNFLLTSATKFDGRIFLFDRGQSARLLFSKLGGTYHVFPAAGQARALRLNPFTLEPGDRNAGFLLAWTLSLAESTMTPTETHREKLRAAIAALYAGPSEQRHLPGLVSLVSAQDAALGQALAPFVGGGDHAGLFDAQQENFDLTLALQAFDMEPAAKRRAALVPLFSYLLHRIITSLDGRPAIIALHDAWDLLENPFFAPRLESLLQMLKEHNVMLLCTTRRPQDLASTATLATLLKQSATQLYLPDDVEIDYRAQGVGLEAFDHRLLRRLDRQKGDVLLKQGGESIALRINFDEMDDVKAIFAGDIKNLIAAGGRFASLPQDG